MQRRVIILSGVDPTRAYSCIKYLYQKLKKEDINVEVWSNVPETSMESYRKWGNNVFSFRDKGLGKIPRIRAIAATLEGLKCAIRFRNQVIICHDLYHFFSCYIIKKLYPNTIFIHYCTEIYNKKSKLFHRIQHKLYSHIVNSPDLIIECDPFRAQFRKRDLNIKKQQVVILNTIPQYEIEQYCTKTLKDNDVPVICFSGGLFHAHQLDIMINAMENIDLDYELRLFCYGNNDVIKEFDSICKKKISGKYDIIANKSREETLTNVSHGDIGIVYYNPDYSINTRYAAPTKFFEYIGLGLIVVSSNNESLTHIIDEYDIGNYMKSNNESGLKDCIEELLNKKEYIRSRKQKSKDVFNNSLSYEIQSLQAFAVIFELINS